MTITIPDSFDNESGLTNYDTNSVSQPITAQLLANRHVDLRIFDTKAFARPRTMHDLETTDPSDGSDPWEMDDLDTQTMEFIENVQVLPGETWTKASGTGGDVSTDPALDGQDGVGPWGGVYHSWRALKFDCDGADLNVVLVSDWPDGSDGVATDITGDGLAVFDTTSIVIDDSPLSTGAMTSVSIQMNSDDLGAFGMGADSATVTMTNTTGHEWACDTSDLAAMGFDATAVTGVKLTLKTYLGTKDSLETTLVGGDNDLVFEADAVGASGLTVEYLDPGAGGSLSVALVGGVHIRVTLATDGGDVITSTAADVMALVNADGTVGPLVTVSLAGTTPTGAGLVTVMGETPLAGGNPAVPPTAGDEFYVFALRCYETGYDPTVGPDINTRFQALMEPVTFALSNPASASMPMVRGTTANDPGDPRVQDGIVRLHVYKSLLHETTGYNYASAVFREDRASDSFVLVGMKWLGSDLIRFSVYNRNNGSVTAVEFDTLAASTLDPSDYFIFEAQLQGRSVTVSLYESDETGRFLTSYYSKTITPDDTVMGEPPTLRGRVGYYFSAADSDAALMAFSAVALAYSTYITKAMESFTPVDGVQLQAAYSLDDDVFTGFTGGILSVDTQRTLSADGSIRTPGPIASNSFLIFNYDQSYIECDIWVPAEAKLENQPRMVLRSPVSAEEIVFDSLELQGNQWNHVYIDLGNVGATDGIVYQLYMERSQGEGTTYEWNVDNMVIGVRNVAWSARSSSSGDWIAFGTMVNDQFGAVHFPRDQRGTLVQIKAEALTEKAWIGPFSFEPHYAELGKPTYLA